MPILLLGFFDKDLGEDTINNNPGLYKAGGELNFKVMLAWIFKACYQAGILLAVSVVVGLTNGVPTHVGDLYSFGTIVYTALFFSVMHAVLRLKNTWNVVNAFFWVWSVGFMFFFVFILAMLFYFDPQYYQVPNMVFSLAFSWALVFVLCIATMVTDILIEALRLEVFPTTQDHAIYVDRSSSQEVGTRERRDSQLRMLGMRQSSVAVIEPPVGSKTVPIEEVTNTVTFKGIEDAMGSLRMDLTAQKGLFEKTHSSPVKESPRAVKKD